MKSIDATAKAMTDKQLMETSMKLRKQIPASQSLLAAVKREQRKRSKRARENAA